MSALGRIWAIALNTFREAVRDRVLHGVLAFAIAVLVFTLALAQLSLDQERRVVHDVGLASISLFSVLVAIFLGSSLLYKEIERKTLYVILPKPIRRHEFLLGKYFGIVLTAFVFIVVMGVLQLLIARLMGDVAYAPILSALVLTFGEVLVLAAIALFFSSFSTPFLTGVFTLGVWLVGRSAGEMATMRSSVIGPEVKRVLAFVAEVAPNLNLFVPTRHALEDYAGHGGPGAYVAGTMGYGVLYAAIVLTLAALVFRKRDFT